MTRTSRAARRGASFGVLLLALAAGPARAQEPAAAPPEAAGRDTAPRAAVFPAELDDPTLPYGRRPPPAVQKRLALLTDQLRDALAERGGLVSVDLAPQAEAIRTQSPLYKCNGCAVDIARALGAEFGITALAEKGSPQVHNLTVTITQAATGKVLRQGRVVISANTDDDWRHAARSVVRNGLLAQPLPRS